MRPGSFWTWTFHLSELHSSFQGLYAQRNPVPTRDTHIPLVVCCFMKSPWGIKLGILARQQIVWDIVGLLGVGVVSLRSSLWTMEFLTLSEEDGPRSVPSSQALHVGHLSLWLRMIWE